MGHFLGKHER
ncbi:hypothetical protein D1010_16505 [Schleiferilactobacillus harbinensis]|uniref:Uncharacterized protein n=1 Tax=Schleiferilactobacillus harbinensis TaxID=304207 RepID=A0A5P8MA49_9LACO|nr:hypothetical protein D1010_16505 [Schleiferilactobacillus harbinensis]